MRKIIKPADNRTFLFDAFPFTLFLMLMSCAGSESERFPENDNQLKFLNMTFAAGKRDSEHIL